MAGYELKLARQKYIGPAPRPYPVIVALDTLQLLVQRSQAAIWGERRWALGHLTLDAGLRLELPGTVANAPRLAWAPRLSARYATGPSFALSAAFARVYQYTQTVAPAGPGVGPDLHLSDVWLMADDTVPALRSDLVTLGAEAWLGPGWLGTVTAYGRYVTGMAVPDPVPGSQLVGRPPFVTATNRAAGLEVSLRRMIGRVTGSIGYSEGVSELAAGGWSYPASAERRRMLDLTTTVRLAPAWHAGGALTVASGAPFTRFLLRATRTGCDSLGACADSVVWVASEVEQPDANRAPAYVSLDLFAEWRHRFGSWTLGAFLQVRNALNRRNAVTYRGSYDACAQPSGNQRAAQPGVCDDFDRGLPLLPLVGVSVTF
jgi:hypothetical protein